MTKKLAFWFLCALVLMPLAAGFAQKVKYKDIFALLNTKQYEQAEPFLRRYIKANEDNPNAFLFMGIVFQDKSLKLDVLRQTQEVLAYADSSLIFFDKAYRTIDDREIRKNKEYYEAYNRRDLRTGEFGVKLSDIQFDLDQRVQTMRERKDKVKMVKYYFVQSDSLYRKTNRTFRNLQSRYPSERSFLLRADGSTVEALSGLATRFDSCMRMLENYRSAVSHLGRTGYNHVISMEEIQSFTEDGRTLTDFFQNDLGLWDYRKFADKHRATIEKEVLPMQKHLISYDIEINKLNQKLERDSVSVRSDLTKLIDVLLFQQMNRFDPDPLPARLFTAKTSVLEYKSIVIENRSSADSADLHYRIRQLKGELDVVQKIDTVTTALLSNDIDVRAKDYERFVSETFGSALVLRSYVRSLNDFAQRESRLKLQQIAHLENALNWVVDGNDSIPLSDSATSERWIRLMTQPEAFTLGLKVKDSVRTEGYFYQVTPSRKPGLKVLFPVNDSTFTVQNVGYTKALSFADAGGQFYYVLIYADNMVNGLYPVTLAKIYKADGLAWSNHYQLPFRPVSMTFKNETSEVVVGDETTNVLTFDKNGKIATK